MASISGKCEGEYCKDVQHPEGGLNDRENSIGVDLLGVIGDVPASPRKFVGVFARMSSIRGSPCQTSRICSRPRNLNRRSNLKSTTGSLERLKECFQALDEASNVGGVLPLGNTALQSAQKLVKAVYISVDLCRGDIESIRGGRRLTLRNAIGERADERLDFGEHRDSELRVLLEGAAGLLAFSNAVGERADKRFDFSELGNCELGVAGLLAFGDAACQRADEGLDFSEHGNGELGVLIEGAAGLLTSSNAAGERADETLDFSEHGGREFGIFSDVAGSLTFGDAVGERADKCLHFRKHGDGEFRVFGDIAGLLAFGDATCKTTEQRFNLTKDRLDTKKAVRRDFASSDASSKTLKQRLDLI
jgi:hypothetical protein